MFQGWGDEPKTAANPLAVTIKGNTSMTATFVRASWGGALCGVALGGMLPFMILGLWLMKGRTRRRNRATSVHTPNPADR
jgi:hypothetical protein